MEMDIIKLKNKKAMEYMGYIKEHRNNVEKAYTLIKPFIEIIAPEPKNDDSDSTKWITLCDTLIKEHDLSKYSDAEFEPYRKKFFPAYPEETDEELFDEAVQHHYSMNPHHPEHFQLPDGSVSMDMMPEYIVEMACDLMAVSMVKGGNPCEFWKQKSERCPITEEAKATADVLFRRINTELYGG